MLLTDLRELKKILEIDDLDTSEDIKLNFFIEWASSLIVDYLGRDKILDKRSRTEYYNGSGTQKIMLRSTPVFTTPTIRCFVDEEGEFGQASDDFLAGTELTYGDEFFLAIDEPDGTSRSGLLIKKNGYWPKPVVREAGYLYPFIGEGLGTIKVIYVGGYTTDSLPPSFRAAANLLCAKLRYIFPLGLELTSESYEERAIGMVSGQRNYLLSLIKPILFQYRRWSW